MSGSIDKICNISQYRSIRFVKIPKGEVGAINFKHISSTGTSELFVKYLNAENTVTKIEVGISP